MLDLKRRKAETKLIKLRLIKKLHEGLSLSQAEGEYLKRWREAVQTSALTGILTIYSIYNLIIDLDLVMVPEKWTPRSIGSLSKNDQSGFEDLDFVNWEALKPVSLNDLILELSLFYDDSAIQRVYIKRSSYKYKI